MASDTPNTILLEPFGGSRAQYVEEAPAGDAITPGHLIEYDTSEDVIVHATGDAVQEFMVALENPYADDQTAAAIDTAYATADTVRFTYAQRGDVLYMFLSSSSGAAAVKGISRLASQGDGALSVVTVGAGTLDGAIIGVADEDKAVGASDVRLRVRIM